MSVFQGSADEGMVMRFCVRDEVIWVGWVFWKGRRITLSGHEDVDFREVCEGFL